MLICGSCDCVLEKDDIALSKKLFGRKITEFFCVSCIAEYFGKTEQEMRERIEDFRKGGCTLF